jgi:ADP-ribosylglycohydrolase
VEATCVAGFRAPFSVDVAVRLPAGFLLVTDSVPVPAMRVVYCRPKDAVMWADYLLPPGIRADSRYDGYHLAIEVDVLFHSAAPAAVPASDAVPPGAALRGCLLGTALGDALGLPFEGLRPGRIARLRALPLRHRFLFGRGMVSDDTEHACLCVQALLASHGDPEAFARRLAWGLRWWLLGLPAGIGWATLRALGKLWLGFPPARSGVHSAGNGPAMRSPILGVFARADEALQLRLVTASTRLTHTDPQALIGARIAARAAALSAAGQPPGPAYLVAAFQDTLGGDARWAAQLQSVSASLARGETAPDYCRACGWEQGVSGYILHTLAVVLHIWLRHPRDYRAAISEAVMCGGDTDTVAAILGGIVGAGVGEGGLPAEWRAGLIEWPRSGRWMQGLAAELAVMQTGIRETQVPRAGVLAVLLRNAFFMAWVLLHGLRRLQPPY